MTAKGSFTLQDRPAAFSLYLVVLGIGLGGCHSDESGGTATSGDGCGASGDCTGPAHGAFHRYVVNSISLPASAKDFAIDLNGDGIPDNQLGALNLLTMSNTLPGGPALDPTNQAIVDGRLLLLLGLQSSDPTLKNDTEVAATAYIGKTMTSRFATDDAGNSIPDSGAGGPDFSGGGSFAVDHGFPQATSFGLLMNGNYSSNKPAATKRPVNMTLHLALLPDPPPLTLVIRGAHIQFTTSTDRNTGVPALLKGEIHGAIKHDDVQATIVPAIAKALTRRVCTDGLDQLGNCRGCGRPEHVGQILSLFDGGCEPCGDPPVIGCGTAKAMDCRIDACEVAGSSFIKQALAPDVQLYDASGNWAPNPSNAAKDAFSLGIGFTAVRAYFE